MAENRSASLLRSVRGLPSRRHVLRGLAGAGLGLHVVPLPEVVAKRRRRRKIKRNAFGCVNVGDACKTADQCCSGICEGKKGKQRCRAHDTGGCPPGPQDSGCSPTPVENILCTTSAGNEGYCNTTTGNAGFCVASGTCHPCRTDAECQAIHGPQAACTRCDTCLELAGVATSCAHA